MALARARGGRFSANIWPGFVDAMTALLMVMMFVLTIFMVVQFALRETISTQDDELAALTGQVADLADALGLERDRNRALDTELASLTSTLTAARDDLAARGDEIAALKGTLEGREAALAGARETITAFEARVAALIADRAAAGREIDRRTEAQRVAEARNAALQALADELRAEGDLAAEKLSAAETQRLADAAAARALRERLRGAEDELTSMTLALEAERRQAEDTLTKLAAAESAGKDLDGRLAAALLARQTDAAELDRLRAELEAAPAERRKVEDALAAAIAARLAADEKTSAAMSAAEQQAVLLRAANDRLSGERAASAEAARKLALLNRQVTALRSQLGALQTMLDASDARDADAKVQIEALGTRLNSALAQVASEQSKRALLEEQERRRLEEENRTLSRYRSEFFGRLSELLEGREGVRVVGDRFVFSSEVLYEPGSAVLSAAGRAQIAEVTRSLQEIAAAIPDDIDWIIRVDGHTDNLPLSGIGRYRDNWELSLARALAVVRYMQDALGFPPDRLAAAGFGEYRPVADGDSEAARAQNRRIELKLTER